MLSSIGNCLQQQDLLWNNSRRSSPSSISEIQTGLSGPFYLIKFLKNINQRDYRKIHCTSNSSARQDKALVPLMPGELRLNWKAMLMTILERVCQVLD